MLHQAIPPFFVHQNKKYTQQFGDSFKTTPVAYVAKLDNEGIGCCCWTPVLFNRMEMEIVGWRNQSEGTKKNCLENHMDIFFDHSFYYIFSKYGHQNHIRAPSVFEESYDGF